MFETIPSLVMNFLIQTTYLVPCDNAINLASIIESTIVFCFKLFELTTPPL